MPSPRRVSWAKFRVTVVSTVAVLILLTLVYLLSGATLLHEKTILYVYIPDATGIAADSPVEVNGIVAGKVESVELTGSNVPDRVVRVTLDVLRDRLGSITDDSYVQIASESLVGDKLIAITSGTSPTRVRPRYELRYKAQADLMKSLDLTQFERQLRAVDAMLTDIERGKSAVGQFVLGEQMYSDLGKRVGEIERAVQEAANTTSSVGEALYTDRLYTQIREPILRVDESLAQIQSGQGAAGQFLRDPAQFESFRNDIAGLRKSIADLRGSAFLSSDDSYTGWNRSLATLIQNVDQVNTGPLFNTLEMYDSLTGASREMTQTFRDFRQNPKKFLRLKVF
jgi:phospholipid/cholesterol/gamma-HCH transport system substrate-binding protein